MTRETSCSSAITTRSSDRGRDLPSVVTLDIIGLTPIELVDVSPVRMRGTMRFNGAGLARFLEWHVNSPGPLIANVPRLRALNRGRHSKTLQWRYGHRLH